MLTMRLKVLVISVILLEIKYAESTYNNPSYSSTRVTYAPSAGSVDTTNFIEHLENNITSYVQKCCKDEQLCSNSSLSLSSEVYSWPIVTKIDLTNLMKDIKRSIKFQIQLFSVGMNCQDQNQSFSFLPQLQTSIINEINTKVNKFIDTRISTLATNISNAINELADIKCKMEKPRDCGRLPDNCKSGVYDISPGINQEFKVYCEMEADSGGWTVFQKRFDGSEDFFRKWIDYKNGFGNLEGEFWLGNDKLHKLTNTGEYELKIDLIFETGEQSYAVYSKFHVDQESTGYKLTIEGYSGTAGDALTTNDIKKNVNGMKFSTSDRDNDKSPYNCANYWQKSGFWSNSCSFANLNGPHINGPYTDAKNVTTIFWSTNPKEKPRLTDIRLMIKLA